MRRIRRGLIRHHPLHPFNQYSIPPVSAADGLIGDPGGLVNRKASVPSLRSPMMLDVRFAPGTSPPVGDDVPALGFVQRYYTRNRPTKTIRPLIMVSEDRWFGST